MVSLRQGALQLLGLRGRFVVGGQNLTEVTLRPEMTISLSSMTALYVVDLDVPDHLLALEHPAFGRRILSGVMSIQLDPTTQIVAGAAPNAAAIIWGDGIEWFARHGDRGDTRLVPGQPLILGGETINVTSVAVGATPDPTSVGALQVSEPLTIVARYDTVHIHRSQALAVVLDGLVAQIVSDLAIAGVPMGWQILAADLWRGETDPTILRRNWDGALARLRRKLRDGGVRTDLVRSDYAGNFEMLLHRGDRVDDET